MSKLTLVSVILGGIRYSVFVNAPVTNGLVVLNLEDILHATGCGVGAYRGTTITIG